MRISRQSMNSNSLFVINHIDLGILEFGVLKVATCDHGRVGVENFIEKGVMSKWETQGWLNGHPFPAGSSSYQPLNAAILTSHHNHNTRTILF